MKRGQRIFWWVTGPVGYWWCPSLRRWTTLLPVVTRRLVNSAFARNLKQALWIANRLPPEAHRDVTFSRFVQVHRRRPAKRYVQDYVVKSLNRSQS